MKLKFHSFLLNFSLILISFCDEEFKKFFTYENHQKERKSIERILNDYDSLNSLEKIEFKKILENTPELKKFLPYVLDFDHFGKNLNLEIVFKKLMEKFFGKKNLNRFLSNNNNKNLLNFLNEFDKFYNFEKIEKFYKEEVFSNESVDEKAKIFNLFSNNTKNEQNFKEYYEKFKNNATENDKFYYFQHKKIRKLNFITDFQRQKFNKNFDKFLNTIFEENQKITDENIKNFSN